MIVGMPAAQEPNQSLLLNGEYFTIPPQVSAVVSGILVG
jgi:hypothetical protein